MSWEVEFHDDSYSHFKASVMGRPRYALITG